MKRSVFTVAVLGLALTVTSPALAGWQEFITADTGPPNYTSIVPPATIGINVPYRITPGAYCFPAYPNEKIVSIKLYSYYSTSPFYPALNAPGWTFKGEKPTPGACDTTALASFDVVNQANGYVWWKGTLITTSCNSGPLYGRATGMCGSFSTGNQSGGGGP